MSDGGRGGRGGLLLPVRGDGRQRGRGGLLLPASGEGRQGGPNFSKQVQFAPLTKFSERGTPRTENLYAHMIYDHGLF